jgi:hypothetical protein
VAIIAINDCVIHIEKKERGMSIPGRSFSFKVMGAKNAAKANGVIRTRYLAKRLGFPKVAARGSNANFINLPSNL